MHRNWLILLILLSILAWLGHRFWPVGNQTQVLPAGDHPTPAARQNRQAAQSTTATNPVTSTETGADAESGDATTDLTSRQQSILDEIDIRQFSEDPYLEVRSLAWQMGFCHQQEDMEQMFGSQPTVTQNAVMRQVADRCEQLQSDQPNLLALYADKNWQQVFKPQSQLGRLYPLRKSSENREEIHEITRAILIGALQTRNGALILEESLLGYLDHGDVLFPIKQILGTGDHGYAHEINRTALTLMACEFNQGVNCQADGMFMLFVCAYQLPACGQEYGDWYAANALPGMQRDVQIMIDHYRQFSQPQ